MRISVVGAGAVGCFLGARLHAAGHEVTLVGRPNQVAAIRSAGLHLREGDAETIRLIPAMAGLPAEVDLVLMAVKSQDLAEASAEVAAHPARCPVVTLQNGVRADEIAGEVLGRGRVLGGVVMCAVSSTEAGAVSVLFNGWLVLGEPFLPPGARLREVAAVLGSALPTYLTGDLLATRWTKLLSNLNNGIAAATGLTFPEIGRSPDGVALSVKLVREGVEVARRCHIELDHGFYGLRLSSLRRDRNTALIALLQGMMPGLIGRSPEKVARVVLRLAARSQRGDLPVRGSLWQSLAKGRSTEIDYLNGEVVRRAQQLGIAAPYNTRIVEAVHLAERSRKVSSLQELLLPAGLPAQVLGPG
jgi:2-dehydropantoate 2-reductase